MLETTHDISCRPASSYGKTFKLTAHNPTWQVGNPEIDCSKKKWKMFYHCDSKASCVLKHPNSWL
jgi:hypothetical protein